MAVPGIDVASYQPTDYSTAGLGFVMVKATEGAGYVNPRHAAQIAHARAHQLVPGHYHFARPGSVSTQVTYFLQHAAPQPGDILCLDWEDSGVSSAWKDLWIKAVQTAAPGHRVILYCNRDFWLNRDSSSFCGDGLWIADPDAPAGQPRVHHPWTFHQYGIRGADLNVANFPSTAALRAWAAGTTPHTTPEDTVTPDDIQAVAAAVMDYEIDDPRTAGTHYVPIKTVLWWAGADAAQALAAVRQVAAQVGALTAALTALATNGGLTAEQITAAAEAGADAALAKLGDALTTHPTTGA